MFHARYDRRLAPPEEPGDAMADPMPPFDRRRFLAALGLAGAAPQLLLGAEPASPITKEAVAQAEKLAGLAFSDADRELMLKGVEELAADYEKIRQVPLPNQIGPAFRFDPAPPGTAAIPGVPTIPAASAAGEQPARLAEPPFPPLPDAVPARLEDLAFWPVTRLARLVRERKVTSVELTKMYLARLRRLDPTLLAVITFTEERALRAGRAGRPRDRRRPLARAAPRHPLGGQGPARRARATRRPGAPVPFKEQVIDEDATVVERLDEAGAVLVAKLTLGELAWGDVWFGGMTRNPWKTDQGSSGSSAGSAAATAAGAVGFSHRQRDARLDRLALHPHRRHRPAPDLRAGEPPRRHGALLDHGQARPHLPQRRGLRAGVRTRSTGRTARTRRSSTRRSRWDPRLDVAQAPRRATSRRRFEEPPAEGQEEWHALDLAALAALAALGLELVPIELPKLPIDALSVHPDRGGRGGVRRADPQRQRRPARAPDRAGLAERLPPGRRRSRPSPTCRRNRIRTLLMREMDRSWRTVDAYVVPDLRRQEPAAHEPDRPPGGGGAERLPEGRHAHQHHLHGRLFGETEAAGRRQGVPGRHGLAPAAAGDVSLASPPRRSYSALKRSLSKA